MSSQIVHDIRVNGSISDTATFMFKPGQKWFRWNVSFSFKRYFIQAHENAIVNNNEKWL